jgi:hypothetical protein
VGVELGVVAVDAAVGAAVSVLNFENCCGH